MAVVNQVVLKLKIFSLMCYSQIGIVVEEPEILGRLRPGLEACLTSAFNVAFFLSSDFGTSKSSEEPGTLFISSCSQSMDLPQQARKLTYKWLGGRSTRCQEASFSQPSIVLRVTRSKPAKLVKAAHPGALRNSGLQSLCPNP